MDAMQKLDSLEQKIIALRDETLRLRSENENMKTALAETEELIVDLRQQLKETQPPQAHGREQDPEATDRLRKQLDKYIEELNKCIEWMENA